MPAPRSFHWQGDCRPHGAIQHGALRVREIEVRAGTFLDLAHNGQDRLLLHALPFSAFHGVRQVEGLREQQVFLQRAPRFPRERRLKGRLDQKEAAHRQRARDEHNRG